MHNNIMELTKKEYIVNILEFIINDYRFFKSETQCYQTNN